MAREQQRRFLLGNGHNLVEPVTRPGRRFEKAHPYTVAEAKDALQPMLRQTIESFDGLPQGACPHDEVTALLTLHPAYIAKSFFPTALVNGSFLRTLGSRSRRVTPRKPTARRAVEKMDTIELFVAGQREQFRAWAENLDEWARHQKVAEDIRRIEDLRPLTADLRLRPIERSQSEPFLELVLHARLQDVYVLDGLQNYLRSLGLDVDVNRRRFQVGGLWFIPLRVPRDKLPELARFSFLRVVRPLPTLREVEPFAGTTRGIGPFFQCKAPDAGAVNPDVRAVVFDGGLPADPNLDQWVDSPQLDGLDKPVELLQDHGLAVTSSLLFGPVRDGHPLPRPPGVVDHYRVLDRKTGADNPDELYDVLARIEDVLRNNDYKFVNLSIGPNLPVEDDDVHLWTAVLDQFLSEGQVLACVAVGNGGELDRDSGNARVQVPSDCVNGLGIGACDHEGHPWKRASYSSVGPGRRPGVVKPDIVSFGGSATQPFGALARGKSWQAAGVWGTSLASPLALRTAMALRAYMGVQLTPLALKALLVNRAERSADNHLADVGWGRIPTDLDSYLTCVDGEVRVVYYGRLRAGKYVRAQIPLAPSPISGMVTITATFCFACQTDPQDAANYTRSGLEIIFRPDTTKIKPGTVHPESRPFFSVNQWQDETERRTRAFKWETTLHCRKRMRGSSLNDPVFDIHHGARQQGQPISSAQDIPYALVVNIECSKVPDLYNKVLTRYRTRLRTLAPIIQIPVRVGV